MFDKKYYNVESNYSGMLLKGKKPLYNRFWIRRILQYKEEGNLLDIGCGMGFFLEHASKFFDIYGSDISEYGINEAKNRVPNIGLCIGDVQQIGIKTNSFDIITCFDVVEHLKTPEEAFKECYRILKDTGLLIVTTPNMSSFGCSYKKENWFAYRDSTHISLLKNEDWLTMLNACGYQIREVFYDGLWDTPYLTWVPKILQTIFIKYPSVVLFGFGLKFPQKYGENICIVAEKKVRNG